MKTARELFLDLGFIGCIENECGVYYSTSNNPFDLYLGDYYIFIDKDGSFEAYEYSNHEGNTPIEFTKEMTNALIQQFREFNLLK